MIRKKPVEKESPRRRFTDTKEGPETVIGAGLQIKGEIRGKGNVELRGRFEGTIETEGLLAIRSGGTIQGEITATNVVVEGKVKGNTRAADKVELRSNCEVNGDIQAETLAIAEGCFFAGRIEMSEGGQKARQVTFKVKRTPES